jgi:outer membrane receptor protein involved in Fe transport
LWLSVEKKQLKVFAAILGVPRRRGSPPVIPGRNPAEKRKLTEKMQIIPILLTVFFTLFFGVAEAWSEGSGNDRPKDASRFQMDEIVVTATRVDEKIRQIPKNITVITSADIARAPSNNIVDLLSREADLNLRSFFGHDGRAGVDIRGMGDTFVSNVVIMVDGYRLNATDMSGANISSIPLGRVERIEIVRGGGSVMYGDGAVGGVVNIITKQGPSANRLEGGLYTAYGSWDTFDSRFYGSGKIGRIWANLDASYYSTDGYRDHGYYRKKDARIDLGWKIHQHITLTGKVALHDDQIGFPGPVSSRDVNSRSKRKNTSAPDDFSKTTDNRYHLGFTIDGDWGSLNLKTGYRDRENPYILGYSPIISKDDQTDEITEDTGQINLTYEKTFPFAGCANRLLAGMDFYDTEYQREDAKTEKKHGDTRRTEWFFHNEVQLIDNLQFSFGYRGSSFRGEFRDDRYVDFFTDPVFPPPVFIPPQYLYSTWVKGDKRKKNWHNNAYELGLTWQATPALTLFASHSKSYRIPNIDELALSDPGLAPQKGFHWDLGSRYRWRDLAELNLTLFQIRIEDEIYYGEDPITHARLNRNYDEKTRRRGLEVQARIYPADWFDVRANYSWLEAKFEERKTYVPLAPKHKATVGLEVYPTAELTFSIVGTYVGSRYDGNDQDNNLYDKLDDYRTVDCKLTWQRGNCRIFAGINNILDEMYSTSSYSNFQYPMPLRSFYGGMELVF